MEEVQKFAHYPSLKDRVIVISGGATGIGGSLTRHFALQGSQVLVLDILPASKWEEEHGLGSLQVEHQPIFYHCDMTDIEGSLKPVAEKILSKCPRIDGLINNAANDRRQPTLEVTEKDWDQSVAVNLKHQFFLTQALLSGLTAAAPTASVINMGSISWAIPATGLVPYTTSKAAVVGLTKTLAHEFGAKGIRFNSIMPGPIATERQKRDILTPEYESWCKQHQALKHLLQPSEVARLALWLIADDSSAMTNQSIVLDGGWV